MHKNNRKLFKVKAIIIIGFFVLDMLIFVGCMYVTIKIFQVLWN